MDILEESNKFLKLGQFLIYEACQNNNNYYLATLDYAFWTKNDVSNS